MSNEYTYQWNADTYEDSDDRTEPILKISKSSLGSFQWCPQRYEYQYPMRLPIDQTDVMRKGSIIHNAREDWFKDVDIKKAETLSGDELASYFLSVYPIDDYSDMYQTMAIDDANRFMDSKIEDKVEEFLPVVNEIMLDAEIVIPRDIMGDQFTLGHDYVVHLQGIIDRMYVEDGGYIPMELKTGNWKDWKKTMMRKEMAFYQILFENCSRETLLKHNIDPDINMTHWGWYYPASNYTYVEEVKKSSKKAVMKGIAKLLHSYEMKHFEAKFYAKTCVNCSFYGMCPAATNDGWN